MTADHGELIFRGDPLNPERVVDGNIFAIDVTDHIQSDPARRDRATALIASILTPSRKDRDFCIVSNEVGVRMETEGFVDVAVQCYLRSFQTVNVFRELNGINLFAYAGNMVKAIQRVLSELEPNEDLLNLLRGTKGAVEDAEAYLEFGRNNLIYKHNSDQLHAMLAAEDEQKRAQSLAWQPGKELDFVNEQKAVLDMAKSVSAEIRQLE